MKARSLMISKVTTKRIRLEKGPANETKISSLLGCLKYLGSTGTGLPQPTSIKAPGVKIFMRGIMSVPHKSMWGMGEREMRPKFLAVSSPHQWAARAWALSCQAMLKSRIPKDMIFGRRSSIS